MAHSNGSLYRSGDSSVYSGEFWLEAGDRAWKTAAGSLLAAWGGDWVNFYNLGWDTTWRMTLALVVMSLLGSVISAPAPRRGSPTIGRESRLQPPAGGFGRPPGGHGGGNGPGIHPGGDARPVAVRVGRC